MNAVQRLLQHLQMVIITVQSVWKQVKSTIRDPVKIWELALKVILNLDSHLFILPLTVSTDSDGQRTVRIPANTSRRVVPCILSALIALRIGYLLSISSDNHFTWLVQGQFTADASAFVMLVLITIVGLAIHVTFLKRKEDFAFLCNSVFKLNTTFSRT